MWKKKNSVRGCKKGTNTLQSRLGACGSNISPCDVAGEKKRVGFEGHGAIGGGRGFGEDQTDQHAQSAVARRGVSVCEQPGSEAEQAGEEELGAMQLVRKGSEKHRAYD